MNWLADIGARLAMLNAGEVPKCPTCHNYMVSDNEPDGPWRCHFCPTERVLEAGEGFEHFACVDCGNVVQALYDALDETPPWCTHASGRIIWRAPRDPAVADWTPMVPCRVLVTT